MADVVRLKEWLSRSPRRETIRRDRPAEVLLFTGVRYERLTPAMLAATQRSRPCPGKDADSARRP